jgi:hypothetical protein
MGTYYGYVNRDQDKSIIDWAGITKKISDDILAEKNSREARRFELDKTQNEQLRKLDEYTQGIDKTANQAAMEAAQGYRDFLMENHKLMKAGLVSVNDSKIVKENAKSTWGTLNKAFKGHQDAIQAKVDQGGAGNLLLAEKMSTAFDFQNKKIVPSRNGEAVFVNIDPKTGKMDMETAMPVSGLLNNQQRMWDTIDVQESASKAADAAAIWKKSPTSTLSIKDVRQNPEFAAWKENSIKAALDTPQRTASVLMDYAGVDPDDIKMVEDSQGILQPELTPEQIKAAKDAYGSALEIGLGYEETKTEARAPNAAEISVGRGKKDKEAQFRVILAALQGDEAKYKTMFDPMDQALVTMDPVTGEMTISGKDPINVSKDQSISQVGGRIAAQMGLSAEEFTEFINKQNLENPMVSQNVVGFDTFDTTRAKAYVTEDNISKLNKALIFETGIGEIDKTNLEGRRNSFRRSVTEIAGPARVNVEVLDDDTVIVGDITIPNGITKPKEVLEAIEASKKPKKKKLPQ